jgi:hypothetical protein
MKLIPALVLRKVAVKYNAILENGEIIHIEGPFKLYFQTQDSSWWDIFFFYWPGFEW